METYIVVISSGAGLNSEVLFTTDAFRVAALAVRAIQEIAPAVNAAVYSSTACLLRVRDGRWSVPVPAAATRCLAGAVA